LKAHDLNPKNVTITEVLANTYEKAKDLPNAVKYYREALNIDSNTYNANINMAIFLYNEAVKMNEEANKIPTSKQKEYELATLKVNEKMKLAIPYFEVAVKSDKSEINDKETLRKIYVRLNMMDKASALKKEIDAAKAAKGGAR
jgi:Tfp pilus assembly protein PilF